MVSRRESGGSTAAEEMDSASDGLLGRAGVVGGELGSWTFWATSGGRELKNKRLLCFTESCSNAEVRWIRQFPVFRNEP